MKIIALKFAGDSDRTSATANIPAIDGEGVDLGCVGRALGLDPSTVKLNGYFVSRGHDLVSKLSWSSLLGFFAARGFPIGGSLFDPIVVEGKPIADSGLKRKAAIKDENSSKRSRFVEGCSKAQIFGNEKLADNKYLCNKRQLKLFDDHPSKKGKIDEYISDCHSSPNMKDVGRLLLKSENAVEEGKISRKKQFLERRAIDQNLESDDTDFLCIKKRLNLDDEQPTKKKIGECNSETGLNSCSSFINVFGKRWREAHITHSVFCKRTSNIYSGF